MRVTGRTRVNRRITALRDLAKLTVEDMRAMTGRVDQQFRTNERRLFSTEGDSGGPRWKKLTPKYKKRKERLVGRRKIMVFSGRTRKAATRAGGEHVAEFSVRPAIIKVGVRGRAAELGGYHRNTRDIIQMTRRQARGLHSKVREYLVGTKLKRIERALLAGARAMSR